MKKFFFRSIFFIIFLLILSISYLSIIGIETKSFNKQISKKLGDINKNLQIELKEIKILLDPFRLNINIKTIGPVLISKDKSIEIETIKTQISLSSLLNNQFSLNDLEISTKPLKVKNFISFLRTFKNTPEIYLFERLVKKGFLIIDTKIQFDDNGKIKNNYHVKGIIRNTKISIFKRYKLDDLNFTFNLREKNYELNNINLLFNDIPFLSNKIVLRDFKDFFSIEGSFKSKENNLEQENINLLNKTFFPNLKIKNINFESSNKISLKIDKKYKIRESQIFSEIDLKKIVFLNEINAKNFLPKIKPHIELKDHSLKINYDNKNLLIEGSGKILLQDKDDKIKYYLKKNDKNYNFKSSLIIEKNPFNLGLLNYEKNLDTKLTIDFEGTQFFNKKTIFKSISFKENKNRIIIHDLLLNEELEIEKIHKVNLDFKDKNNFRNELDLFKKKETYTLVGKSFNADNLIEDLINGDIENKKNIFSKNFNLSLDVKKIYLDKDHSLSNLTGNLKIKKNKIFAANLNAQFSKNKRMKFTINSNEGKKITTLFLDKAEPIVKRYKFIKGYENGSLDFYSSKNKNKSESTLKIYDFKLKELPALTKLLTLASLQGIADILSGEGIRFDEFEMNFTSQANLMTIKEIYAIGPAISILMNGYVEKDKIISLRGTLVPATTINKAIGSIPVLGKILVGSKTGEGVFGVSFKIKGPPKKLETTVNPIKTLTPRFITRTLEKIKKN